jgi:hypothetical protein
MKIYICFALLIFMVTPSLAEVYKCKVNGKLVYSQIRCSDEAVKMNIIRYKPPTPEDIYKQEMAAQQGEIDKQKQAQDDQNARRRYAENVLLEPAIEHDLFGRKAQRANQANAAAFLGIDLQKRGDKTHGSYNQRTRDGSYINTDGSYSQRTRDGSYYSQ